MIAAIKELKQKVLAFKTIDHEKNTMHNCRYALSFTFGSKGKATGNYWK